jgi:hypothetical protein
MTPKQLEALGVPGTVKAASALGALADLGVVLGLEDFATWLNKTAFLAEASNILPGVFRRLIRRQDLPDRLVLSKFACADHPADLTCREVARSLVATRAVTAEAVMDRAMRSSLQSLGLPRPRYNHDGEKQAGENAQAVDLAEDYAAYQLAALHHMARRSDGFRLTAGLLIGHNRI